MRRTTVKQKIDWFTLNTVKQQADYLGKSSSGFKVMSESSTELGVVEIVYTYNDWDFDATVLIVPILDSNYVQIIHL